MVPWVRWNKFMGPRPWGHQALRWGYNFLEENNEAENVSKLNVSKLKKMFLSIENCMPS